MSVFFVDTSALAKRYIAETGSQWVKSWIEPGAGHIIVISELTTVEFVSLLARRQREKSIPPGDFALMHKQFSVHAEVEYVVVDLNSPILMKARDLLIKYPLRTLDAIQLASSLSVRSAFAQVVVFVSADNGLLGAAAGEGFTTENPLSRP